MNELNQLRSYEAIPNEVITDVVSSEQEVFGFENDLVVDEIPSVNEPVLEEGIGIKERLIRFDNEVIKTEFTKTEAGKRLLRPEMLEALLEHLPTSKAEFQEVVQAYLITGTVTYEAKFLDDVLSLIADYA